MQPEALGVSVADGIIANRTYLVTHGLYRRRSRRPALPAILSLENGAAVQDTWLRVPLDVLVTMLMRRAGIDMYIVTARV